jgi:hypothetical protein
MIPKWGSITTCYVIPLQNILFSIHTQAGNIIYREIDLERMCALMIEEATKLKLGQDERHLIVAETQEDIFHQMKQFFAHKI